MDYDEIIIATPDGWDEELLEHKLYEILFPETTLSKYRGTEILGLPTREEFAERCVWKTGKKKQNKKKSLSELKLKYPGILLAILPMIVVKKGQMSLMVKAESSDDIAESQHLAESLKITMSRLKSKKDGRSVIVPRDFPWVNLGKGKLTYLCANYVGQVVFPMGVTVLRGVDFEIWNCIKNGQGEEHDRLETLRHNASPDFDLLNDLIQDLYEESSEESGKVVMQDLEIEELSDINDPEDKNDYAIHGTRMEGKKISESNFAISGKLNKKLLQAKNNKENANTYRNEQNTDIRSTKRFPGKQESSREQVKEYKFKRNREMKKGKRRYESNNRSPSESPRTKRKHNPSENSPNYNGMDAERNKLNSERGARGSRGSRGRGRGRNHEMQARERDINKKTTKKEDGKGKQGKQGIKSKANPKGSSKSRTKEKKREKNKIGSQKDDKLKAKKKQEYVNESTKTQMTELKEEQGKPAKSNSKRGSRGGRGSRHRGRSRGRGKSKPPNENANKTEKKEKTNETENKTNRNKQRKKKGKRNKSTNPNSTESEDQSDAKSKKTRKNNSRNLRLNEGPLKNSGSTNVDSKNEKQRNAKKSPKIEEQKRMRKKIEMQKKKQRKKREKALNFGTALEKQKTSPLLKNQLDFIRKTAENNKLPRKHNAGKQDFDELIS